MALPLKPPTSPYPTFHSVSHLPISTDIWHPSFAVSDYPIHSARQDATVGIPSNVPLFLFFFFSMNLTDITPAAYPQSVVSFPLVNCDNSINL